MVSSNSVELKVVFLHLNLHYQMLFFLSFFVFFLMGTNSPEPRMEIFPKNAGWEGVFTINRNYLKLNWEVIYRKPCAANSTLTWALKLCRSIRVNESARQC